MMTRTSSFSWPDNRMRAQLPIDEKLTDILSFLNHHKLLICEAGTGAGKTTRIPQAVLLCNDQLKITMTQPRRNACRLIAKRVAQELGAQLGQLVGWSLFNEKPQISRGTRLEFVVDQSLVNRISQHNKLPDGLIIIDEAHERSVAIDLLLGLIKEKLPYSTNTKVLITSATIDTEKFSRFFDHAPVISVAGRCFPVSTDVCYLQRGEHHTEGAIRAAKEVLHNFQHDNLFVTDGANNRQAVEQGTILVLLPGKEDINNAQKALSEEVSDQWKVGNRKNIEILSCHGGSSTEEQDFVQTEVSANTLRFICCTELLRASVTVPGCVGVIDSLQVKRLITNEKGIACLDKVPVSKAEADQAKGRAGRIASGFYIPVSFNNEYEALVPYPQPAILREPMTRVVLQIIDAGFSVNNFAFIDQPSDEKVSFALTQLQLIGAITKQEVLTESGKLLTQLPIDPEHGVILMTAKKLGVLPEAMIVIAGLEAEGVFYCGKRDDVVFLEKDEVKKIFPEYCVKGVLPAWVKKQRNRFKIETSHQDFPERQQGAIWVRQQIKMTWAGEAGNDFASIVRGYRAYKQAERLLKIENHIRTWCISRGVNFKSIRLMDKTISQIEDSLKSSHMNFGKLNYALNRDFDEQGLLKAIVSGKATCVAKAKEYSYIDEFSSKLGSFSLSKSSACPSSSKLVLIAGLKKIHVRGGDSRSVADCASPIEANTLSEIMPQLCMVKRDSHCYYNAKKDLVTAVERHYFDDDIELEAREVTLSGKEAVREKSTWLAKQIIRENKSLETTSAALNRVLLSSIESQSFAKKMNRIAGEAIFKVYSYQEWYERIFSILYDIDSLSLLSLESIKQLEMPALDRRCVHKIYRDNPDNIVVGSLALKVDYQISPLAPMVQIKECEIPLWFNFLNSPLQLPGGRQVNLRIIRGNEKSFDATWINGHINLNACDITNVKFVDDKQFCLTRLDFLMSKSNFPYFLPLSAFDSLNSFRMEINRLDILKISFDQIRFVQWSILSQTLNCSKESMIKACLELLMTNMFMRQRSYLSGVEVVGNLFVGFFYQNLISVTETIARVDIANFMNQLSEGNLPIPPP